ncbi:MAG: BatD family protein [Chitinophagales bacterium]|nr:BatD family protein [Chitinophagales bacterium]
MKYILNLSIIYLFSVASLTAQESPVFTVTISSDSILMGNMIKVAFTLENGDGNDFQAPGFGEFDVVSGPNISNSFSMINGDVKQSIAYTYYIQPRDIGNYYIEPASIAVGGEVLETIPYEVIVVPNPDGIIQQPDTGHDPFNFQFESEGFPWPDFPSFDFDFPHVEPQAPAKPKRKTYRM